MGFQRVTRQSDTLDVEAFHLALPALATIERLIVSAQKRLNVFLDDLERTSKITARALRVAAEEAIPRTTPPRWRRESKTHGVATTVGRQQAQWREGAAPLSQQGKARSRMNALRHGLAAASINTGTASADGSSVDMLYQRLRQIEVGGARTLCTALALKAEEANF